MKNKRLWIADSALFKGLDESVLDEVDALLHPRTVPGGTLIMMEDHKSLSVGLIVSGTVKITVSRGEREALLNIIGEGELLGEMHLLDGRGHSADILTLNDTTLLWMELDHLSRLVELHPCMGANIARILSRRLRLATGRIEALSTLDVPGRVAHQLLVFATEYGQKSDAGVRIPLCLTQTDLATLVGATRTRVNQALMAMRKSKLVSIDKDHYFTVLNPDLLNKRYVNPS